MQAGANCYNLYIGGDIHIGIKILVGLMALTDVIVVYHFVCWIGNKSTFGRDKLVKGYAYYLVLCVFEAIMNYL